MSKKKSQTFFLLLSFPPLLLSLLFILALCLSACLGFFQFLLSLLLSSLCLCVLSFCKMRFFFQSNLNSPRKKSSQQKLNPSTYSHAHTAAPHTHISITFRYMSILNRYLVQLPWRSISFFLSLSYSDGILFQISFVVPSNVLLSFFLVVMWAHECASMRSDVMLRFTFSSTFFYYHYNYTKSKTTCVHVYFTFPPKGKFPFKKWRFSWQQGANGGFRAVVYEQRIPTHKNVIQRLTSMKKGSTKVSQQCTLST